MEKILTFMVAYESTEKKRNQSLAVSMDNSNCIFVDAGGTITLAQITLETFSSLFSTRNYYESIEV